jgi:hypothetical protein
MHFYAWREGLKTGQYYLRTQSKAHAIQFTVDKVGSRSAVYKCVPRCAHTSCCVYGTRPPRLLTRLQCPVARLTAPG